MKKETLSIFQGVKIVFCDESLTKHISFIVQDLDACYEVSKARFSWKLIDYTTNKTWLRDKGPKLTANEETVPFVSVNWLSLTILIIGSHICTSWK